MSDAAASGGVPAAPDDLESAQVERVIRLLGAIDDEMVVEPLVERLGEPSGGEDAVQCARSVVWRTIRDLDARRLRLQRALVDIDDLDQGFRYIREFGDATWPSRRAHLLDRLAADPAAGAAEWLRHWTAAVVVGRYDEALRLLSDGFHLAPELGWLPDRLVAAVEAMRTALTDADDREQLVAGLRRCRTLLQFLADGAVVHGHPMVGEEEQLQVAVLLAQWVGAAGEDVAPALALAERLGVGGADLLTVKAIAAESPEERGRLAREALALDGSLLVAHVVAGQSTAANPPIPIDASISPPHLEGVIQYLDALPLSVPGTIWLALARAAVGEGHHDAMELLDRAERAFDDEAAAGSDADGDAEKRRTLAIGEVRRLRADGRAADGAPAAEVADLLTAAAAALVEVHSAQATTLYERALQLVPDHQDAALGLADAIRFITWRLPLTEADRDLRRGLDLVASTHARFGVAPGREWSLLVEAELRQRLSTAIDPGSRLEAWKALDAAARSCAYPSLGASAWSVLAGTLSDLSAFGAAAAAAQAGLDLVPSHADARDELLKALVNLGESRAISALFERIAGDELGSWHVGVRAYSFLVDDPTRAYRDALDALEADAANPWLHWLAGTAATLGGSHRDAESHWRWLWRESPRDSVSYRYWVVVAATELGYVQDSVELCRQIMQQGASETDDGEVQVALGSARLLGGDPGGLDDLVTGISLAPTRRYLEDHKIWTLDRLPEQARQVGVTLPDLGAATAAWEQRREELRPIPPEDDIVAVSERAAADANLARTAGRAARATAALLLMHRDERERAGELLRQLCAAEPDVVEYGILLARVEEPPEEEAGDAPAMVADEEPAPDSLPADGVVRLVLPTDWFAGIDDPVQDHEVLNQHLPDARSRVAHRGVVLPPVVVFADEGIGPGGFHVSVGGVEVGSGVVEMDRLVCLRDWLPSLPAALREAAAPVEGAADRVSVPVQADAPALLGLVTWTPAETAVRALEALALAGVLTPG